MNFVKQLLVGMALGAMIGGFMDFLVFLLHVDGAL
jgi:hypothetical protein